MKTIFVSLILIALFSCRQESGTKNYCSGLKSARETLHRYYDDIRRKGLLAEFDYLDSSDAFFWAPPGYASAISYDSVSTILNHNAPALHSVDNSFDTLHMIELGPELVSYTGSLRSVVTDTSGKTATYYMVETGVMVKRNTGWKLLCGQTTLIE